jgi:hypothetical protein
MTVRTLWMVRGCSFTLVFAGIKDLFYSVACISLFGRIPDDSGAASQEVELHRQLCLVLQYCDTRSSHSDVLHEDSVFWTITPYRCLLGLLCPTGEGTTQLSFTQENAVGLHIVGRVS